MTERKGTLMRFQAECGHWMVVYSLEPTPKVCPDCSDADLQTLSEIVDAFESAAWTLESEGPPGGSKDDVDQWCDECEITDAAVRETIHQLAALGDDLRATADDAVRKAKAIAAKHPAAERLTMPEAS